LKGKRKLSGRGVKGPVFLGVPQKAKLGRKEKWLKSEVTKNRRSSEGKSGL